MSKPTILFLDGGMGTMLQQSGVSLGKVPEELNIREPDVILDIHRQYIEAGADVIYANTFSANRYKLRDSAYSVCELVTAGIQNARRAAAGTGCRVALDIGPIGQLLEPNGNLSFEEAYDIFREMLLAGEAAGADLVVFETMTDLLEVKAAVLAARECTKLPVWCTMTFEENGRTFTGTSIPSMGLTLTALGVDALGFNCSLGPKKMVPFVKELAKWTPLPLILKPNAGLPNLNSNTYDMDAAEFAAEMTEALPYGACILGGCCGTTPEFIRTIKKEFGGCTPAPRDYAPKFALCSASHLLEVDGVCIVGERINPTGKKRFKEALQNHNIGYILTQALEQVEAGAKILDVNVGLPGIDEKALMVEVVKELQSVVDVPLQIDSSNAEVLEAALRVYNGKPLVNSVNGEPAVLARILPLVKKYGASVIGLCMDENGIPLTAEERFVIAKRIVETAASYGIPKEDLYIDCLTLTASVQQKEVMETLRAMTMVKEQLGVKTTLGVSNISFGLPNRPLINTTFLTMAMQHGLDLPIINPNLPVMTGAIDAFNVLTNRDVGSKQYLEKYGEQAASAAAAPVKASEPTLDYAVLNGLKDAAKEQTKKLLASMEAMDIVNQILIPTLDEVGIQFETGKLFLPQLLQSATAAQAAFDVIKERISSQKTETIQKGRIIVATVKGDVHDIGKNIVKVILENYGYDVIDLGKDVPIETVVEETIRRDVKLVGLSALMTTTVVNMEQTIRALREAVPDVTIWVGGAVLTPDYAKEIGADFYAKDAKQSVDIAKQVLG